jgi:hypothetical protein
MRGKRSRRKAKRQRKEKQKRKNRRRRVNRKRKMNPLGSSFENWCQTLVQK